GRIRGQPGYRVGIDVPPDRPLVQQAASDVVQPETLASLVEDFGGLHGSPFPLPTASLGCGRLFVAGPGDAITGHLGGPGGGAPGLCGAFAAGGGGPGGVPARPPPRRHPHSGPSPPWRPARPTPGPSPKAAALRRGRPAAGGRTAPSRACSPPGPGCRPPAV